MRRILIIVLFFVTSENVFSQSEVITRRDDRYLKENAIIALMNSLEISMNVITAGEAYPNEIKAHIDKILTGDRNERLFVDDQVRVENDLTPGADQKKTKEDKIIRDYFEDMVSLYKNPDANSIVFDKNYKVSNLKKSAYYYYNVVFNCSFKGADINGKSYNPVGRIAEIKIVGYEGKLYPFINGIRFYNEPSYDPSADTVNVFNDFPSSIGDNDSYIDYLSKLNAEKSRYFEERDKEVRLLLEESKKKLDEGDIFRADSLISYAWVINPADRMVLSARANLKSEKERIAREKKEREEKAARINVLKDRAMKAYNTFDFELARRTIDSLHVNYNERGDAAIENINRELTTMQAALDPVHNAISGGRGRDAIKLCDGIIKKQEKSPLAVECHYQKAVAQMKLDSNVISKIFDYLASAIDLSEKKHVKALYMRASLKRNHKKYDEALSDASYLVNNNSDDPRYYDLRASVYEAVNRKGEAIADYAMAVKSDLAGNEIYSNKARLEVDQKQYSEALRTCNEAITKSGGSAGVFYYRALAGERLGDYQAAGKDFYAATKLSLDQERIKYFRSVVEGYFKNGKSNYDKMNLKGAIDDLNKSLLLDTSNQALFWLGKAYRSDNQLDKADEIFSQLIIKYPDYNGAYFERGLVRRSQNLLADAVADFSREYEKVKTKQPLHEKVRTLIMMGKYEEAGIEAEKAAKVFSDSLSYQLAAEGFYKAKKLDKVQEVYDYADKVRALSSGIHYYYARMWYDKGDTRKASSYFEEALEVNPSNSEAAFWSGFILYYNEKYEDAFKLFERALSSEVYGRNSIYMNSLCRIKFKGSNYYKLAADDLSKLIESYPDFKNAETYSWLAYCNLHLGNDQNAVSILNKARTTDSLNVYFNFVSACYHAKFNEPEKALMYLERALIQGSLVRKSEVDEEAFFENLRSRSEYRDRYKKILKNRYN